MPSLHVPASIDKAHVQGSVRPPPTVVHEPVPGAIQTNDVSGHGQRGWLTDRLRGKRVWCILSINHLFVLEEQHAAVLRQVILLAGCTIRQLQLKPADGRAVTHNGLARRFMSTSVPRRDQFHLVLKNPATGQQFLFGADTQCELDQWRASLGRACSLGSDSDLIQGLQTAVPGKLSSQLMRVCSEPWLFTNIAQEHLSDPCPALIAVPSGRRDIFLRKSNHAESDLFQSDWAKTDLFHLDNEKAGLVQAGEKKLDLVQSYQENTDLAQSDQENTDLVQSDRENTDLVQPDRENTYLAQSEQENKDLVPPDREKTDLVQSDQGNTDLVQYDQENTDLVQSDQENTDLAHSDRENIDLAQSDQENKDLVQPDQMSDLVPPDQEKTDLVQRYEEKTNLVQRDHELTRRLDNAGRLAIDSSNMKLLPAYATHDLTYKANEGASRSCKHDLNYNTNAGALRSSKQSSTRQARSPLRIQPALCGLFRRMTRSASTGLRRHFQHSSDPRTAGNITWPLIGDDSSRLHTETPTDNEGILVDRHRPASDSGDEHRHSNGHSFGLPGLAGRIFADGAFYKDVFPRSTGRTLQDLREVALSGYLLHRTGSKLRRVYCALSAGRLYVFGCASLGALPVLTVTLCHCSVTCASDMHERSRNLFLFKLNQPRTNSICLYADSQLELLTWLTAIQSASVRIQTATDIVSERSEGGPALGVTPTSGQCLSVHWEIEGGTWHSGKQTDVHGTWLPHFGAPKPGTELSPDEAPEPGTELSPHGAPEHEVVPEPGQDCYPSTLQAPCMGHVLTSQNSVYQPVARLVSRSADQPVATPLEKAPGQDASADPCSSCHVCPECHQLSSVCPHVCPDCQQFSSLHPILSTHVLHKEDDSVRAPLEIVSHNSEQIQNQAMPAAPVNSVTPNSSIQTEPSWTSQALGDSDMHNVQVFPPVVCSPSQQALGVTDIPAISQHDIYSPGFVSTQQTNHQSVLDPHVKTKQSLLQNADNSKRAVPQLCQMSSLVHDEAVKLAWATTQGCLLEVLKGKVRHRNMSGTVHTDLCADSRDVCIVEDGWNLADPNMPGDISTSFGRHQQRAKRLEPMKPGLESMKPGLDDSCPPNARQRKGKLVSTFQTSAGTTHTASRDTAIKGPSADIIRQGTSENVKETSADTVRQDQSLDSVKQRLWAEICRQKLQLAGIQAEGAGKKAELAAPGNSLPASPARGSQALDDDLVCLLTKLTQRRMSTQIQLNAVHNQMESSRVIRKEKKVFFLIGKKKIDLAQGHTETERQRARLEEQARILSEQLHELDKCLASCGAASPVPESRSQRRRFRHSYDQTLLKNIQLSAEAQPDTSSDHSQSHQRLKEKVSQVYRSVSLKTSVHKLAQKTFSIANWHTNKRSTHPAQEKGNAKASEPTAVNGLSDVVSSVSDTSRSVLSEHLSVCQSPGSVTTRTHSESPGSATTRTHSESPGSATTRTHSESPGSATTRTHSESTGSATTRTHSESPRSSTTRTHSESPGSATTRTHSGNTTQTQSGNTFVNSTLPRPCPAGSSLQEKTSLARSPSVSDIERCTGNVELSPSLAYLNRCAGNIQTSLSMTHLDRYAGNIKTSATSSSFNNLSLKQGIATRNSFFDISATSQRLERDLLHSSSVSSQRLGGDLLHSSSVTSHRLGGDLLDSSSVTSPPMEGDSVDTSLASQPMDGVVVNTDVLSACVGAASSAPREACEGAVVPSGSPSLIGQEQTSGSGADKRQVIAGTLAEIQVFEALLVKCLGADPSIK
ncbi:hypothetical protein BsWGS_26773 [Bradybaena similaris]